MVGDAIAGARRFAVGQQLDARDEARLCIVIEELITNMIEHGGHHVGQPIAIKLSRVASQILVQIEDQGPAFDPREWIASGQVPARGGGAGLRLVMAWSTIVAYRSDKGYNRLELSVLLGG